MHTPAKHPFLFILAPLFVAACSSASPDPAPADADIDEAPLDTELTAPDTEPGPDLTEPADPIAAADYCERSQEMFCSFYMRCGRMAVDDLESCRETFAQACNARYEPYYRSLADADLLHLSKSGLDACAERLASVSCEAQVFDLDGCDAVWVGHVPAGGPCGPGLESFVCAEDTVCHLDLSFCGTCQPRAADGEACGASARCDENSACVDGSCARRPHGGEACSEDGPLRCVVGTSCTDRTCSAPAVGGAGAACADDRNCRYRASCVDNVCVQTALRGEPCGDGVGCASGYCDDGRCEMFAALGQPCTTSVACETGACLSGKCAAIRWGCVQQ